MKIIKLFEKFNFVRTVDELKDLLDKYGIPTEDWGKGTNKSLNHLLIEIKKGESSIEIENGEPIRSVSVVTLHITYNSKKLKEDFQKFSNGRIRRRNNQSSCSEKIHKNEGIIAAAKRCTEEELGFTIDQTQLRNYRTEYIIRDSMSYPGLTCKTIMHIFDCELIDDQYEPNGYIERQEDKSTYFIWV